MHVCARLVATGKADGFISAGNTGACMAIAKMVLGSLPGVDRPALHGSLPTFKVRPSSLLTLRQRRLRAADACSLRFDGRSLFTPCAQVKRPRVGLFPSAKKSTKGNALHRKPRRSQGNESPLFGNVEGRDIFSGEADVIVCDGFVGNVALKVSEGLADMIRLMLRESLEATLYPAKSATCFRNPPTGISKTHRLLEFGGAPLLGVKGV